MKKRSFSIKMRISLISMAIVLLSITITSAVLFNFYNKSYFQQTLSNKQQTLEQLAINITNYFDSLSNSISATVRNKHLMNLLITDVPTTELGQLERAREIESFLTDTLITPRKDVINVYIFGDEIYSTSRYHASVDRSLKYEELWWYDEALKTRQNILIPPHMESFLTNPRYTVFSYVWSITNPYTNKPLALIIVDINTSEIKSICNKIDTGANGGLIITNEINELVISTLDENLILDEVLSAIAVKKQSDIIQLGSSKYISNQTNVKNYFWTVTSFNSMEEFMVLHQKQILLTIVTSILCGILAMIVLSALTSSCLKPLLNIVNLMKKAEKGDLKVQFKERRKDEIGYLGSSFNHMIKKIDQTTNENSRLLEEIYKSKELQNKSQIQALQSQIKPHFMSNTLNIISLLIQSGQSYEAVKNINNLSFLMNKFINTDKNVPLENELALIRAYLAIQTTRYSDRLEYCETVDVNFYNYTVPTLILQPIIENCIVHGCENKIGKTTIYITSKTDNKFFHLIIKDNANGIDSSVLNNIRDNLQVTNSNLLTSNCSKQNTEHGLALKNINHRIKLQYGLAYGLSIDSVLSEGTVVTLHLPLDGGVFLDK